MRRLSLRGRVTLASLAVLGAGLAILGVATNVLLSDTLSADASAVLRDRAGAELATLVPKGGSVVVRDAPGDVALDRRSWVFVRGRALEQPPANPEVDRVAARLASVARPTERNIGERVRLLARPAFGTDGRRLATVVVGVSLVPYEDTERIARIATLALALFLLAAGALVVRRSVGAALRPVAEMTERAADWSEHDLHRRFDLGPPRDELSGLAATLDGLLGRIDAALRHEQRFSAEMAHELRTPLSGVRGEAELALQRERSPAELRDAMARVLAGTDRMEAAIETLLSAARNDATGSPGSSDPLVAVAQAARAMRPAFEVRGLALAVSGPGRAARVGADEDLVAQALNPLLDNALRHAAQRVTVTVARSGGDVVISVQDDGPGVAEAQLDSIFAPGASSAGGAGLGLPLARRLARSCGGDVVAVPGGGGRFELRLPEAGVSRSGNVQVP